MWAVFALLQFPAGVLGAGFDARAIVPATLASPPAGRYWSSSRPRSRGSQRPLPLDLDAETRDVVLEYARSVPYDVIQRRGRLDSSRWVTGRGAALVVESLLTGGTTRPVYPSTPLSGAYGIEGVAVGVSILLTADGVERIIEWSLPDKERVALTEAIRAVREAS